MTFALRFVHEHNLYKNTIYSRISFVQEHDLYKIMIYTKIQFITLRSLFSVTSWGFSNSPPLSNISPPSLGWKSSNSARDCWREKRVSVP
jgi:hypothetical protein